VAVSTENLPKETLARVMRGCKPQCEGPKVVAGLKQGIFTLQCYKLLLVSDGIISSSTFDAERIWAETSWCDKAQTLVVTRFEDDM
jgi:hypothetical protein